jgi:glycerophosphoryl diester phosphodiesterase
MDFVCRHGTCDLAFTTDIVAKHPELHKKCTKPWVPGSGKPGVCCTYDFTTAELASLCAGMESNVNASATSFDEYILGPPGFRSGAIARSQCHKLVPFSEYLKLMKDNGYNAIPELKDTMQEGLVAFLQRHGKDIYWLAEKFADELMAVFGPEQGIAQTFDNLVAEHWKKARPTLTVEYMWMGPPARGQNCSINEGKPNREDCGGPELLRYLARLGVNMFSPPINALITHRADHSIVPSSTAALLKDMEVQSIGSWSLEREGCSTLHNPNAAMTPEIQAAEWAPCGFGGGYYSSVEAHSTFQHEDVLEVVDVLFKQVGISKLFADFPATVAAYTNCILDAEQQPPAGVAALERSLLV